MVMMKPNFDSAKIGCVTRAMERIWPSSPAGVLSVKTDSTPTLKPPNSPDSLSPTVRLTGCPCTRPILREKNGRPLFDTRSCELRPKLRPPNSNADTS
ncbi:hypothetical protein D3C83_55130 [compost metagenome]